MDTPSERRERVKRGGPTPTAWGLGAAGCGSPVPTARGMMRGWDAALAGGALARAATAYARGMGNGGLAYCDAGENCP